jgi:tetratricopeptide (TPR) repeat protein
MHPFLKITLKAQPTSSPIFLKVKTTFFLLFSLVISSQLYAGGESGSGTISHDSSVFYVTKGKEFLQSRLLQQAEKSFLKSIEFDPTYEEARITIAFYYKDNRKYVQSREQFGKLLENNVNHVIALENLCDLSFLLHKWEDVIIYGKKLKENNKGKDVTYKIAKAHYELENYGEAIKMLEAAIVEGTTNADVFYTLGRCKVEVSAYGQAINAYQKSLAIDSSQNIRFYELGLLYYGINDGPNATKYMEIAGNKGYKKDNDFYENLGMAYMEFNLDKGVEILKILLERKPDTEIMFQIAQAYYQSKNYKNAIEFWQKVMDNDKQNFRALYMIGMSYQRKGDAEKGIAICNQAIASDPALANLKQSKFVIQN